MSKISNRTCLGMCIVSIIIIFIIITLFIKRYSSEKIIYQRRGDIVRLIQSKKLIPDNLGRCLMPTDYQDCSINGKVYVTVTESSFDVIFPITTGIKSNFTGLLYHNGPEFKTYAPGPDNQREVEFIDAHSIDQVQQMDGTIYRIIIERNIGNKWYKVLRDLD